MLPETRKVPNVRMPPLPAASQALAGLLSSRWLRPLNDRAALDDLLGMVSATWSLTATRARVVEAIRRTADARTLVLRPNGRWPGHRAGQHTTVEVEVAGRRLRRTFSLSSPPRRDGLVEITVKRHEGGRVSTWWNREASVGDVLTLGDPAGDFVLPSPLPGRLVLISAGSGITPLMAMLGDLEARRADVEVLFFHVARSRRDVLFLEELEALARTRPGLELVLHPTETAGRPGAEVLAGLARRAPAAPAFVCGPDAFMDDVRRAWAEAGIDAALHFERFGLARRAATSGVDETVTTTRSGRSFVVAAGQSLLEAAEAAGLRPAHGCRIGVCHTCKCRKISGTAEDLRDGRRHDEDGEMIQLCVSTARSPLVLEL